MPKTARFTFAIATPQRIAPVLLSCAVLTGSLLISQQAEAQTGWFGNTSFGATVAGSDSDGAPLMICRSNDPAFPGNHPGKTRAGWNSCSFGFGQAERFTNNYQALVPSWSTGSTRGGSIFGNDGSTALSVCRAGVEGGGLQLGKHLAGVNACAIPYGNQELWISPFDVLNEGSYAIEKTPGFSPFALLGGYEQNGTPLYPCVASFQGGLHPGKMHRDWGSCDISWGGGEHFVAPFSTLIPVFRPTNQGLSDFTILVAGSDTNNAQLGVCRVAFNGTQVGKYRFATNACHISYGGQERVFTTGFETLRQHAPNINP